MYVWAYDNNRTTISLVSIEVFSTATVTTETHSEYMVFFLSFESTHGDAHKQ